MCGFAMIDLGWSQSGVALSCIVEDILGVASFQYMDLMCPEYTHFKGGFDKAEVS